MKKQKSRKETQPNKVDLDLIALGCKYIDSKEKADECNSEANALKEELKNAMIEAEKESLEIIVDESSENPLKYKISCYKSRKVNYDVNKLKKKLNKEIYKKVTQTKVEITNYNGFKELLKSYGIKFEEVKNFLNIQTTVDSKKLQNEYSIGNIDLDKISDCYEVNATYGMRLDKPKNNE